jgi:hypothetical protein
MTLGRYFLLVASMLAAFATYSCDSRPPRSEARLVPGMGSLHHKIHTSNRECQMFFDQGLTLIYAFNFKDAIASFRRASELDPNAAMPFWDLALAYGPNCNTPVQGASEEQAAFAAIQRAMKLSAHGPSEERDLIAALAERLTNEDEFDGNQLARDYSAAMRNVS